MKYLLALLIIIYSSNTVFADTSNIITTTPIYNPYYNNYYDRSYYTPDDISAIEKYTFNRTFKRDNALSRLERLEMQAFGTIQNGNYTTRYENVKSAILSRPKQNFRTTFARGLQDYFNGQLTGFTPSIYPTTYGNQNIINYGAGPLYNGFRYNNFNTGSNSGVHIIH